MGDDFSDTISPKSDQLNADDLITGPITVAITSATKHLGADQPMWLEITGGHKTFKPCLSMRRLIIEVWKGTGSDWIGKRMTLFRDPNVLWKQQQTGGLRISHMSGIDAPVTVLLTVRRGIREPYTVQPLPPEAPEAPQSYPADLFSKNLPAWTLAIQDRKMTGAQIIMKASERAPLTDEQKERIIEEEEKTL